MRIIRLTDSMINQIAAGEVVERPASVVKELLENAVDAGASRIDLVTADGGKSLIKVTDNGHGMSREELAMAVQRHCTSKLSQDLMDIRTLGFRGEALPSIGSIARLAITSRSSVQGVDENAWRIVVDNGTLSGPDPAALNGGSVIEVGELFSRVPARLKFLKSDRAESAAITDVLKRMALAFPHVHFSASGADRTPIDYPDSTPESRISQVIGRDFVDNAMGIDAEREGIRLSGLAGLPTFNRGNALNQFFFVNGRPVRDKQLLGAVRGAYADFLPRHRHPVLCLFLELPPQEVDVNVHPAKADVRFRDGGLVRGLIVGALRQAITRAGHLSSSEGGEAMMSAFRPGRAWHPHSGQVDVSQWNRPVVQADNVAGFAESQASFDGAAAPSGRVALDSVVGPEVDHPLGAARAQLHKNYIVSQTRTGLIIVDQHAAHERIVYEALKKGMDKRLPSQMLLIPEIVDLPEEDADRLDAVAGDLQQLGLGLEKFGPGAVAIRETPAMLGEVDVAGLVRDLADELAEWGSADGLKQRLWHVAATLACHGSVRSGRELRAEEMNALLREMEVTPNSGQCNHGRPTWVELDLKDIERLFGR